MNQVKNILLQIFSQAVMPEFDHAKWEALVTQSLADGDYVPLIMELREVGLDLIVTEDDNIIITKVLSEEDQAIVDGIISRISTGAYEEVPNQFKAVKVDVPELDELGLADVAALSNSVASLLTKQHFNVDLEEEAKEDNERCFTNLTELLEAFEYPHVYPKKTSNIIGFHVDTTDPMAIAEVIELLQGYLPVEEPTTEPVQFNPVISVE